MGRSKGIPRREDPLEQRQLTEQEERHRARQCGQKTPYPSRAIAKLHARKYLANPMLNKRGPVEEYKCPWCHNWHLGHNVKHGNGEKRW